MKLGCRTRRGVGLEAIGTLELLEVVKGLKKQREDWGGVV
jgi:hypothetical protein